MHDAHVIAIRDQLLEGYTLNATTTRRDSSWDGRRFAHREHGSFALYENLIPVIDEPDDDLPPAA